MAPVHDTQDGDSFVVAVTSRASASTNQTGSQSWNMPNEDPPDPEQSYQNDDSDVPSPSVADSVSPSTGVHIHRLGHQQRHGRLPMGYY